MRELRPCPRAGASADVAAAPLGSSDRLRPVRRWRPPVPKGVATGAPLAPRFRLLGTRFFVGVSEEHRRSKMLTFALTLPEGGVSSLRPRGECCPRGERRNVWRGGDCPVDEHGWSRETKETAEHAWSREAAESCEYGL